jgi:predicted dehydrogenase
MATLTAGLIGCGGFAHTQHLPNCEANPDITIKWACDINEEQAKKAQREYSIPCTTTSPEEVFNDAEVDVVILATWHAAHLPLIRAAAAKGKHILCEKPMSLAIDEGLEIVRIVQRHGVKLCVDHNRRCAPAIRALKRDYEAFRAVPTHQPWRWHGKPRPKFRDEVNPVMLVRVQDESSSHTNMAHKDPVHGGGAIIGESTHWYDLIAWMFPDDEPVSVMAWGARAFNHGVVIEFRSGALGELLFHTGGTFDYPKELYEITWNGGLFRSEFFVENNVYGVPQAGRTLFPLQRDPMPETGAEGGIAGYMAKVEVAQADPDRYMERFPSITADKGHVGLLNEFVAALLNDTPTPCDEVDGFRAVYIANLAIESLRLHKPMPVEMCFWHPRLAAM